MAILVFLKQLKLVNFRNYSKINIKLGENINIIYGNNAQGKTNILESIYLLALSKSHRTSIDNEMIMNEKNYYEVEGIINKNNINTKLKIKYDKNNKEYLVDNNKKNRLSDYLSNMNVIIFYPDDIEIIKGLPENRRKFLNLELSQMYPMYYKILNDYNKLLKIRNDILKKIKNHEKVDLNYLTILNEYYIDKAIFIIRARDKFIKKINVIAESIYEDISKYKGYNIKYKTYVEDFSISNELIKEKMKQMLNDNFEKEKKLGTSLIGPHRDDFEFYINDTNIRTYGSQGQQRLAVLSLKLSEIKIFENQIGEKPILLLDDVFSEFDKIKKNNLLKYIDSNIQTIITTTDLSNIKKDIIKKSKLFYIEKGNLIEK